MLDYNELYEYLRKEKYSEPLQALPKTFISDVSAFLNTKRAQLGGLHDLFSEEVLKAKKQFENAVSIFRELMRVRKRKILNLVFVASETGIMKRDFTTLLNFEQDLFEKLVSAVGDSEKELQRLLNGSPVMVQDHKMVLVTTPVAAFVDMSGGSVGPFEKGVLVNLDAQIADLLIAEGKATVVDSA
jgi:DNA replication initiation complex subunit (GINS family)